jgi:signal transduction histidine kinase
VASAYSDREQDRHPSNLKRKVEGVVIRRIPDRREGRLVEPRVLFVNGERRGVSRIPDILEPLGFPVDEVTSAAEALPLLLVRRYSLIILDLRTDDLDAHRLTEALTRGGADVSVLLVGGDRTEIVGRDFAGVAHITAPVVPADIRRRVLAAVERSRRLTMEGDAAAGAQRFMTLAAHEMRGPVGTAAGYLSMLEDGTLGDVHQSWAEPLRSISLQLQRLQDLSDELMAVARAEMAGLEPADQKIDLDDLAASAVARARPRATLLLGRIDLVHASRPVSAHGDPAHLGRVLDNLILNALAYSGTEPVVTVTVGPGRSIRVGDHGPGITEVDSSHVFDRYRRGDHADANPRGSGLGLYLARELARASGGDVVIEETSPRGSVFALTMDAAPSPASEPAPPAPSPPLAAPAPRSWVPLEPGESAPETVQDPAEAERWALYYSQLVVFEIQVLGEMHSLADAAGSDLALTIELCDIAPMRELIGHFANRAALWLRRNAALAAAS